MKRIIILLLPIIIYTHSLLAQNEENVIPLPIRQWSDSLQSELKTVQNDSLRAEMALELGLGLIKYNIDEAGKHIEAGLSSAQKADCEDLLGKAYYLTGLFHAHKGEQPEALHNLKMAIKYLKKSDRVYIASLLDIAQLYRSNYNYEESIKYAKEGTLLAQTNNQIYQHVFGNTLIGNLLAQQNSHAEAIRYYRESLDIIDRGGVKSGQMDQFAILESKSDAYLGIAESTTEINEALTSYKYIIDMWEDAKTESELYVLALGGVTKKYIDLIENDSLRAHTSMNKGQLLAEANSAISKALKILLIDKNIGEENKIFINEVYASVKYYSGDYKLAYEILKECHLANTSIFSQQNKNEIATIQNKMALEIRDQKIEISELTIKNKEKQVLFFLMASVLLVGIIFLVFHLYKSKKRNNRQLQLLNEDLKRANEQKASFLAILNHDLRAPVALLIESLRFNKELAQHNDAETMERYHRKTLLEGETLLEEMEELLVWCKSQMQRFGASLESVNLATLFAEAKALFASNERVEFVLEVSKDLNIYTDKSYLKTILRNLILNANKAIAGRTNPCIKMKAVANDKHIIISVEDNGVGLSPERIKALSGRSKNENNRDGIGLQIVKDLAKEINCSIEISSEKDKYTIVSLLFTK